MLSLGAVGIGLVVNDTGEKETFNAEAEAKEYASPLSTIETVPAYSTTPGPVGVSATATPKAATSTPSPTPTPTPEITDGTYVWRWGAWRDPVTDRAYVAPTPTAPSYYNPVVRGETATSSPPSTCPPLIAQTFGWPGCAISFCESGWDSNAVGDHGLALGWFQVRSDFHFDATLDPAGNVAAAWRISGGGTSWGAWSVQSVLYSGVCPNARGAVPS